MCVCVCVRVILYMRVYTHTPEQARVYRHTPEQAVYIPCTVGARQYNTPTTHIVLLTYLHCSALQHST